MAHACSPNAVFWSNGKLQVPCSSFLDDWKRTFTSMGSFLLLLGHAVTKNALSHHYEPHSHISNFLPLILSRPRTSSCIMTGTIITIRANGSLAIPAVQYLLTKYPDYTVVLTIQNALEIDVNTKKLRDSRTQYPTSKSQSLPLCCPGPIQYTYNRGLLSAVTFTSLA